MLEISSFFFEIGMKCEYNRYKDNSLLNRISKFHLHLTIDQALTGSSHLSFEQTISINQGYERQLPKS